MPGPMIRILCTAVVVIPVAVVGCAKVSVRKVPTPTQYTRWTDDMQAKADTMEGFRFYLPRPFVQVRQSFPIRTENYLVQGRVSADGKYVVVGAVDVNSGLAKYVAQNSNQALIPTRNIRFVGPSDGGNLNEQSGPDGEDSEDRIQLASANREFKNGTMQTGVNGTPNRLPVNTEAKPAPTVMEQPDGVVSALTGINKKGVTNDNGAYAVQPLRGENFDVVYMPDFEEQYCVSSKAALGNAEFELNLGQGWSLQGFNSLSDNSELNKRIFDLIDRGIELADTAATANVDKLVRELGPGEQGIAQAQAGEDFSDAPESIRAPSTDVTLKITVVYYAAKGMYPVMKPREISERVTASQTSYHAIDLFKVNPDVTGVSEFDPSALARAQVAVSNETTDFTVPKYPYQFISFNTFSYMAIEVVHNSQQEGSPFKYRYPDKGTVTDAEMDKDEQSVNDGDSQGFLPPLNDNSRSKLGSQDIDSFESELDTRLEALMKENDDIPDNWTLTSDYSDTANNIIISVDLNGASQAVLDDARPEITKLVETVFEDFFPKQTKPKIEIVSGDTDGDTVGLVSSGWRRS